MAGDPGKLYKYMAGDPGKLYKYMAGLLAF